jgi:hypothetical protein
MKRFTETTKWDDPWFQELPVAYRLFWLFLCDRCDNAGIWKVSERNARFFVDDSIELDKALELFNGRVEDLGSGYWWLTKFCPFQYRTLSESCLPHQRILETLDKHGLYEKVIGCYRKRQLG